MWKGSQVVHTDDFASWDHPLDWHERCLRELWSVLEKGETARFLATDWTKSGVERWVEVDPGRVIFEGVSSSCLAFSPFVDLKVWVKAPRELRLQRGLERDGEGARGLWEEWMREEDKYVAREDPAGRADLVVRGW